MHQVEIIEACDGFDIAILDGKVYRWDHNNPDPGKVIYEALKELGIKVVYNEAY